MADEGALAVVLMSGGLDSCVTAALAHQKGRLAACHLQYGQRSEARELEAFHAVVIADGVEGRELAGLGALSVLKVAGCQTALLVGERGGDAGVEPAAHKHHRQGAFVRHLDTLRIRAP